MMTDKIYNTIKWLAQYVLPALATLYFAVASIWHFSDSDKVTGTIMAVDAFLGLILGMNSLQYNKNGQNTATSDPNAANTSSIIVAQQPRQSGIYIKLTKTTYDALIWVAQYLLPAIGTLYFAISGIWGFANGSAIVGTISAVDAFLGVILGISNSQFNTEMAALKSVNAVNISPR